MSTQPQGTLRLFVVSHSELAFLQKITRAEYFFITDDEQRARQSLREKLSEVVLNPKENKIAVHLEVGERHFLAELVRQNPAFVTTAEREARHALYERLAAAAAAPGAAAPPASDAKPA